MTGFLFLVTERQYRYRVAFIWRCRVFFFNLFFHMRGSIPILRAVQWFKTMLNCLCLSSARLYVNLKRLSLWIWGQSSVPCKRYKPTKKKPREFLFALEKHLWQGVLLLLFFIYINIEICNMYDMNISIGFI